MSGFEKLNEYSRIDEEKRSLLKDLASREKSKGKLRASYKLSRIHETAELHKLELESEILKECDYSLDYCDVPPLKPGEAASKCCPECGRKFGARPLYCPDCLVKLMSITDKVDVKSIESKLEFGYSGSSDFRSFDDFFTDENAEKVNEFDFTIDDYNEIIRDIKAKSFKNLDELVNTNNIDLDELAILDKVILYAKSFIEVDYKSYGSTLGYYEYNRIHVDDRQRKSLQITTIIHELTHFLVKELLARTLCRILDATKNEVIESFLTYVLLYSPLNRLADEYAAHTVEGRFTVLGYQDYSSFLSIQDELPEENVEIAKMIGNTFAVTVKDIMESFLDWDLREEIKEQFLADTIERPDYRQLMFESCRILTDDGMLQAMQLILSEGFAEPDLELLERYRKEF